MITSSILRIQCCKADADDVLENLFDERVRREEGRPVTLGELLSALKDAADDADALKLREKNRIAHALEVEEMVSNVGGRMHNEDLDGDIERCWNALRQTTQTMESNNVPLKSVIKTLVPILESAFGTIPEGYDDDARVSSFIAGLFLTHKGMASITQGNNLDDVIMIEDLWPHLRRLKKSSLQRLKRMKRHKLHEMIPRQVLNCMQNVFKSGLKKHVLLKKRRG